MTEQTQFIRNYLAESGFSFDELAETEITQESESVYHVTYHAEDPYDGADFKVEFRNNEFRIFDSVYGDDYDFMPIQ